MEPYYLTRPNRSLFSEYIGAAEGLCSMRFSCFKGKEEEVTAFFSKSPDKAAFVSEQFGNLLACAKPLVKTYGIDDLKELHRDIEDKRSAPGGDVVKFMHRLSPESMPEHLARRIFDRAAASEDERDELMKYYRARRKAFMSSLSEVSVIEVYPEYSAADIEMCIRDRSHIAHHVELAAGEPEQSEGPRSQKRQREHDGEGVDERLELDRHDHVDEDDRDDERGKEARELLLLCLGLAGGWLLYTSRCV